MVFYDFEGKRFDDAVDFDLNLAEEGENEDHDESIDENEEEAQETIEWLATSKDKAKPVIDGAPFVCTGTTNKERGSLYR